MKSTAKATEKRSRTVVVLAIAVALMLLGSIFAQMFNTSFYKVKVSRISFDTDSGTLSGLLYMPKGVDASNPHPTIVTTHGYLNSAEMQDETAIEMSRRGYVVLALDMYDHGHSHGNADNTGGFFNFWPTSLWDAAQYMYSQTTLPRMHRATVRSRSAATPWAASPPRWPSIWMSRTTLPPVTASSRPV